MLRRYISTVLTVAVLLVLLPSCSSSPETAQLPAARPVEESGATEPEVVEPAAAEITAEAPSFYLPTDVPAGFELDGIRYHQTSDALTFPDTIDTASVVIGNSDWMADTSISLNASRFGSAQELEEAKRIEDGLVVLDGGPDQLLTVNGSSFIYKSLSGPVDGGYLYGVLDDVFVSGFILGELDQSSLARILSTVEIVDDNGLQLRVDGSAGGLTNTIHEGAGPDQPFAQAFGDYELVFSDGTDRFSVMVSPKSPGELVAVVPPFVPGERFSGERGSGYFISQPEVGAALGSRRLSWWVPTVRLDVLFGRILDDDEAITLAESFEEVSVGEWQAATAGLDVTTEVVGPDSLPEDPQAKLQELLDEQSRLTDAPNRPELDVADIAAFVGEFRGGTFAGEPEISWLGPVELGIQTASQDFFPDDVEHVYRALRMLSWSDLPAFFAEARRSDIRGVCCGPNSITLVEGLDDVEASVVAAHELTHLFDVNEIGPTYRDSVELVNPASAVLEGNATRVMLAYNEDRDLGYDSSQRAYLSFENQPRSEVLRTVEFAYAEGERFITAIAAVGGEDAVNQALIDPPISSEQILHPEKYLAGEAPIFVATPATPENVEVVRQGTLGAFVVALTTVRGWGWENSVELAGSWAGDSFVAWADADNLCIAAEIVFDDDVAAATYMARTSAETASVTGATVSILSCGPAGQF